MSFFSVARGDLAVNEISNRMDEKKRFLLRIDAQLYGALEKWAADELRSVNAQIEYLLAQAARNAHREKGDDPNPVRRRD